MQPLVHSNRHEKNMTRREIQPTITTNKKLLAFSSLALIQMKTPFLYRKSPLPSLMRSLIHPNRHENIARKETQHTMKPDKRIILKSTFQVLLFAWNRTDTGENENSDKQNNNNKHDVFLCTKRYCGFECYLMEFISARQPFFSTLFLLLLLFLVRILLFFIPKINIFVFLLILG